VLSMVEESKIEVEDNALQIETEESEYQAD
jgi:hypothetical protein